MVTFEDIKDNENIKSLIKAADNCLDQIGYTEHSLAHVTFVSRKAAYILKLLGYDEHTIELTKIAGYLHDIGNSINRELHPMAGGIMALHTLTSLGMSITDAARISFAIGNHDESTGMPLDAMSAALIIADKSDVRRSRVREYDISKFDIHNRVNYSVLDSSLTILPQESLIKLSITLDTTYSRALDFYEIFLSRMTYCRLAAKTLNCEFELDIHEQKKGEL